MIKSTNQPGSILVPIANPDTAEQLVSTAADLAADNNLSIEVITVARIPAQLPLSEGEKLVENEREVITYALELEEEKGVEISGRIRLARSIPGGILSFIEDHDVQIVLLGWRGKPRRRDIILGTHLDKVLQNASCDVLVKRMDGTKDLNSILLPVAGGPNTGLATSVAGSLARVHEAKVHVMTVHSPDSPRRREQQEVAVSRVIADLTGVPVITQEAIEHESVVDVIVNQSSEHDLVILGATSNGFFKRSLIGPLPEEVGRDSTSPVIMAKQHQNFSSLLSRIVSRIRDELVA